jgi:hypothetical protein
LFGFVEFDSPGNGRWCPKGLLGRIGDGRLMPLTSGSFLSGLPEAEIGDVLGTNVFDDGNE